MSRFDVVAIGNALVDVLVARGRRLRRAHRGRARRDDDGRRGPLRRDLRAAWARRPRRRAVRPRTPRRASPSFGGRAAYIGRVADDTFGKVFAHDLRSVGRALRRRRSRPTASPTGRCLVIVTPDAERTMCTYLGAGAELDPSVHRRGRRSRAPRSRTSRATSGTSPQAKDGDPRVPPTIAHDADGAVALTLSDPFCVERHRDEFRGAGRDTTSTSSSPTRTRSRSLYEVETFDEALQHVRGALRDRRADPRRARLGDRRAATSVHVIDAASRRRSSTRRARATSTRPASSTASRTATTSRRAGGSRRSRRPR